MTRFRHLTAGQLARTSFALAGALLLVLAALANSAQAGCGDYVFVRNASGRLVRASTLMKDHGLHGACSGPNCPDNDPQEMQSDFLPTPREESLPIKLPCNGPLCSGQSQLPAVPGPPPAPPRSSQESTALLLRLNDGNAEPGAAFVSVPSTSDHELHYPQSIFHPPR